jgi:hypothetical protein
MRKVIKVIVVAGLMGGAMSMSGCDFIKGFFRVDAAECKKWVDHVDEVMVSDVKKAAKGCKVNEAELKERIEDWVSKDCTTYDNNQTFRKRDFDCMMKADSAAAIDKCYDGIPTTTTSTSTKTVGKTKWVKKQTKQNTTMAKPELAKRVEDEKGFACDASSGGDDDADKKDEKADKKDDKKKGAKKDDDE